MLGWQRFIASKHFTCVRVQTPTPKFQLYLLFPNLLSKSQGKLVKNHKLYDCMTKNGKLWKENGVSFKPRNICKVAMSPSQSANSTRHPAVSSDRRPFTPSDEIEVRQRCVKCSDGEKVLVAGHKVECNKWKWNFYEFLQRFQRLSELELAERTILHDLDAAMYIYKSRSD